MLVCKPSQTNSFFVKFCKSDSIVNTSTPSTGENSIHPWRPWLFWGLAALFYCYGFFQRVAPSVMIDDLMRDFAVSAALLGNLSAFYFYAYAGLQLPVGIALDRFGPRRVLAIMAGCCGFGSLLFGIASDLETAYLGRLLIGAGAAFTWVGALKVAATWFPPHRFALISGLTMMLGMGGAIGGQGPLAALVGSVGWRDTMVGAAALAFILAILIYLVVRDTPDKVKDAPAPKPDQGPSILGGLAQVTRNSQTWWIGLFGAMMTAPMLSFGGLWGVPFMMRSYGLERPQAAFSISLLMLGWALGGPFVGWLTDRIGRRRLPMIVCALSALMTMSCLIYFPGLPALGAYILLFLNGFASGSMVISFATVREHNRTNVAGVALAFANMMVMSTGAFFQPFIGALLDLSWNGTIIEGARYYELSDFKTAFIVLPACGVMALIAAIFTRETYCRPIHQE